MFRRLLLALAALACAATPAAAQVWPQRAAILSRLAVGSLLTAPITAIDAVGWSATCASCGTLTPDTAPAYVRLTRPGYDATGTWSATAVSENLIATHFVRTPYPSSTASATTYTTSTALSDYVYSTDVLPDGATNNSTEVSPAPTCAWLSEQRQVVAGSVHVEVICVHRNARARKEVQVCIFSATDGTTSITPVAVTAMTQSTAYTGDQHPVAVYQADLSLSGLADNTPITGNAKCYPFVGGASGSDTTSIADSSIATDHLLFSPRVWYRNTTRAANPPRAYVASGGSDTTGQWQQPGTGGETDAIAQAHPFATIGGAVTALYSTTGSSAAGTNRGITASGGLPNYYGDGAVIYLGAGTWAMGGAVSTGNQSCGAVTVTRVSSAARSTVIVTPNGSTLKLDNNRATACPSGALRFVDVTIAPPSSGNAYAKAGSTATSQVSYVNVTFDMGSVTHTIGTFGEAHVFGATVINQAASDSFWNSAGTNRWGVMRGLSVAQANQTSISASALIGSDIANPGLIVLRTSTVASSTGYSGAGVAFTSFRKITYTSNMIYAGAESGTMTGFYVIQNTFDVTGASGTSTSTVPAVLRVSGDPTNAGNTIAVTFQFNTFGGYWVNGRWNFLYDNTSGVSRTHRLLSIVGNITPEWNTKSDLDCVTISCTSPGSHVGNWSAYYGAGQRGHFQPYVGNPHTAGLPLEQQTGDHAYWGLKAVVTESETSSISPQYVNYLGLTGPDNTNSNGGNPIVTAGTGDSDFHLCTGVAAPVAGCTAASPAIGLVTDSPLPFDFAGTARGLVTASGAYAASAGN